MLGVGSPKTENKELHITPIFEVKKPIGKPFKNRKKNTIYTKKTSKNIVVSFVLKNIKKEKPCPPGSRSGIARRLLDFVAKHAEPDAEPRTNEGSSGLFVLGGEEEDRGEKERVLFLFGVLFFFLQRKDMKFFFCLERKIRAAKYEVKTYYIYFYES